MTHALAENHKQFLASLLGKVQFGVWMDILEKDKFSNLSKKISFIFFSSF